LLEILTLIFRHLEKIYLRTILSYVEECAKGKKFWYASSFVQKKDGLMGSDYIVQLAEIGIENIYDFVNILNTLKTGDSKKVVVQRDGKHVSLTISPAARE